MERDRLVGALQDVVRETFPRLAYLGVYEYVVAAQAGALIDAVPANEGIGLPILTKRPMFTSIVGGRSTLPTGARILVQFVNGDPGRPIVVGFDPDQHPEELTIKSTGPIFIDTDGTVQIRAGATTIASEHAISVESVVNLFINFLYVLYAQGVVTGWTGTGKIFDATQGPTMPYLANAINTMLTSAALPTPPTLFVGGGLLFPDILSNIQTALGAKIANPTGNLPGVGCPDIEVG